MYLSLRLKVRKIIERNGHKGMYMIRMYLREMNVKIEMKCNVIK